MCNLYSYTKGPKAIRDLAKAMGGDWADSTGDLAPLTAVFPDQVAPVVRCTSNGSRELVMMRWGFPPPPTGYSRVTVTNIRNTNKYWWTPWLKKGNRCLVPVSSFSELDHHTVPPTCTWFAQDETRSPFFFAGIWRTWTGKRGTKADPAEGENLLFSILTTDPNSIVGAVYPKSMPVLLLDQAARETWLNGSLEEALALQQPAPDSAVKIIARGKKEDG